MNISWHEGVVADTSPETRGAGLLNVALLDEQVIIPDVQVPPVKANQGLSLLKEGTKVLIYRDSAATAKLVMVLADSFKISNSTTHEHDLIRNSFEPGEVMMQALGDDDGFIPTNGAAIRLSNNGDASVHSGSFGSHIEVNDSSSSVEIGAKEINLEMAGNISYTHALSLSTTLLGFTEIHLGIKDRATHLYSTGIHITSLGSVHIGTEEPVSGTLLNGLNCSITGVSTGLATPEISLTGVVKVATTSPLISSLGATISSTATIKASIAAPIISLTGVTTVTGATTIKGATTLTGTLAITAPYAFSYTGPVIAVTNPLATAVGITGKIPILVAGAPLFLMIGS